MNPLENLSGISEDQWSPLHRRALADGCGRVLDRECERVAAADELVALTLPELPALGALAMLAESRPERCPEWARVLSHSTAGVLRLVHGALAAHGRDHGYPLTAWLERAFAQAHERAQDVAQLTVDELPASTLVEVAAEALSGVVVALHRDRLGVPDGLADALASLLVLYAAQDNDQWPASRE